MLFTAGLSMLDLIPSMNEEAKGTESGRQPLSDSDKMRRWQVLMITVGLIVAFHNDGVGVLGGCLVHLIHKIQDRYRTRLVVAEPGPEDPLL